MFGAIISTIITVVVVVALFLYFGFLGIAVPVLMASAIGYVEGGHDWTMFIPAAIIIAFVAWLDYKLS